MEREAANDPEYALKRPYAKEALLTNCWIYSEISRTWYTPEEFMRTDVGMRVHKGKDNADKFKILDPFIAHKRNLEAAKVMQDLNDTFYKKMVDYFEIKRKAGK